MDPKFTEDGEEFTLRVDNNKVEPLELTFELNLQKYDRFECPKIWINDREFEYRPIDALRYVIPLNETFGPIDQVYRIKVADPAGPVGWPFSHENAHVYVLRVVRPPVYKKAVEPVGIDVRCTSGSQIQADKDFNPAERQPLTQVYVQCQYADMEGETYALEFERSLHLGNFNVALKISVEQGYCAMRGMEEEAGRGGATGYICRSAVSEPTFLAIYDNPQVDVVLVSSDGGTQYSLPDAVAVPIEIADSRSTHTLKVLGSDEPWELPVEVVKTASCSTMKCGDGKLHRRGLLAAEVAKAYLCLKEVCTAEDEDRCCEDVPACDTMEESWCPEGTALLHNGSHCANVPCSDADRASCCEKLQPTTTKVKRREEEGSRGGEEEGRRRANVTAEDKAACCKKLQPNTEEHGRHGALDLARKIAYYEELGCHPTPKATCSGLMCFFDESCLEVPPRLGGLGCWAAGISAVCRFCGFGLLEACPVSYDCGGSCHDWGPEHSAWCNRSYDVRCPKLGEHVSCNGCSESSEGLSAVTGPIVVGAPGGAPREHRLVATAAALLGLAALVAASAVRAVAWRRACRRGPSEREGWLLVPDEEAEEEEEEADFLE